MLIELSRGYKSMPGKSWDAFTSLSSMERSLKGFCLLRNIQQIEIIAVTVTSVYSLHFTLEMIELWFNLYLSWYKLTSRHYNCDLGQGRYLLSVRTFFQKHVITFNKKYKWRVPRILNIFITPSNYWHIYCNTVYM